MIAWASAADAYHGDPKGKHRHYRTRTLCASASRLCARYLCVPSDSHFRAGRNPSVNVSRAVFRNDPLRADGFNSLDTGISQLGSNKRPILSSVLQEFCAWAAGCNTFSVTTLPLCTILSGSNVDALTGRNLDAASSWRGKRQ